MKFPALLLRCLVIGSLSIAGCSYLSEKMSLSGKMSWTKANTPADEAEADLDTCESLAHERTKKDTDITQDINAATGGAGAGVPSAPDMQGYRTREDYNQILSDCMAQLGYSRVP